MRRFGLLVTLIYLLAACGGSTEHHNDETMHEEHDAEIHEEHMEEAEEWAEAESFHEIMALTYHPMNDEGNMDAVSENAAELLETAKVWQDASIPGSLDADMVSAEIATLVTQCEELVTLVDDEASDDDLTAKVNEIHDTFHGLQEMLEGGEHNHEE